MNSFRFAFEELPDFWDGEFRSGSHNGSAEICYWGSGEWTVRAISLDCHNGRCGEAARTKVIPLSRSYQGALWDALCESLDHFSRAHIQDAVHRALTADGPPTGYSRTERRRSTAELL